MTILLNDADYDKLIIALETMQPCPITGTLTDQIKLALAEADIMPARVAGLD